MSQQKKSKRKKEFSKKLCIYSLILFTLVCLVGILFAHDELPTDIFVYLIPSCGTIAAASIGFYLNKSKYENLSKQKLRNVLAKMLLQDKIDEETYMEICDEIEHIDDIIDSKMNSALQEAIDEDQTPVI